MESLLVDADPPGRDHARQDRALCRRRRPADRRSSSSPRGFSSRVPIVGSLPLLIALTLLFILANLSVGYTFSTIATNQLQAMQMSFFFFLPNILLSGFMFPFRGMPDWAQMFGEMLPLTHYLRIVRGIMLKGATFATCRPMSSPWPPSPSSRWRSRWRASGRPSTDRSLRKAAFGRRRGPAQGPLLASRHRKSERECKADARRGEDVAEHGGRDRCRSAPRRRRRLSRPCRLLPRPDGAEDDGAEDRHDEGAAEGAEEVRRARRSAELMRGTAFWIDTVVTGRSVPSPTLISAEHDLDGDERQCVSPRARGRRCRGPRCRGRPSAGACSASKCVIARPERVAPVTVPAMSGIRARPESARGEAAHGLEIDRQVDRQADIGAHAEAGRERGHAHDRVVQDAGRDQRLGGASACARRRATRTAPKAATQAEDRRGAQG